MAVVRVEALESALGRLQSAVEASQKNSAESLKEAASEVMVQAKKAVLQMQQVRSNPATCCP